MAAVAEARPNGRLHGLDAIRGVAAITVLLFHIKAAFGYGAFLPKGYLSVDLFFMLSGYVMARTYEGRLAAGFAATDLLKLRYRRLWGAMAVGGICGMPLLAMDADSAGTFVLVAAANLALLPMPLVGLAMMPLNPPGWSIYFELQANLVHKLLLNSRVLIAVLLISAALMVIGFIRDSDINFGASSGNMLWGFPRVLFSYSLGIVLWRKWQDRPPPNPGFPLVLFLVAVSIPLPIDLLLVGLVFPLVIAGGLQRSDHRLSELGAWSFPLYAVHGPIIDFAVRSGLGLAFIVPSVALMTFIAYRFANRRWPDMRFGLRGGGQACQP